MKGLKLSEDYFIQHGIPLLNRPFAQFSDKIAAGLAGAGSECFGMDDELSQDHDWGPGFSFWLKEQDYKEFGQSLQCAYDELPSVYRGFGPRKASPGEEWRVGVTTIKNFFIRLTGTGSPPASHQDWLRIPEHGLAAAINGKIFVDPLGDFTTWRRKIEAYYPEDVRLRKLSSRCISIGQSGQYNFLRSSRREDIFGALFALTQFCDDILSMAFLLNHTFAPYYKLRHRAAVQLPILGEEIYEMVTLILNTTEVRKQVMSIEKICKSLIGELRSQRLTDSSSDFLLDHAKSVHDRISDTTLKASHAIVP